MATAYENAATKCLAGFATAIARQLMTQELRRHKPPPSSALAPTAAVIAPSTPATAQAAVVQAEATIANVEANREHHVLQTA